MGKERELLIDQLKIGKKPKSYVRVFRLSEKENFFPCFEKDWLILSPIWTEIFGTVAISKTTQTQWLCDKFVTLTGQIQKAQQLAL